MEIPIFSRFSSEAGSGSGASPSSRRVSSVATVVFSWPPRMKVSVTLVPGRLPET
ncbi:MAG: hypothetical protein IPP07_18495 [Holophagales bacterium]|nr:hypothetical protein [Holophagales bacterium]